MRRKRKRRKPVRRSIMLWVGGRCVKTVRDNVTLPQAVRESGRDCFFTLGDSHHLTRRIASVRVMIEWMLMEDLTTGGTHYTEVVESNLKDAVDVIRAGVPG